MSGGNWVPHYNSGLSSCNEEPGYSMVCSGAPKASDYNGDWKSGDNVVRIAVAGQSITGTLHGMVFPGAFAGGRVTWNSIGLTSTFLDGKIYNSDNSIWINEVGWYPKIDIDGGEWTLVRHVPTGNKWHPAKDQLRGTEAYGNQEGGPLSPWAWSINFANTQFNEFLFATGDEQKWLIASKAAVTGGYYANQKRDILKSSTRSSPYKARWYRRRGAQEDPWVSLVDHGDATKNQGLLYGENNFAGMSHNEVLRAHKGANVFIRNKAAKGPTKK